MNFRQFLRVLRARSLLVGAVFGAVIALVTITSLVMTPRYTATAQMLIDVKTPDPIAGQVLPAHLLNSYIATQVELMTSEKVALRVVDNLGFADRPDWVNRLADQADANSSPEAIRLGLARLLLKDLKVRPSKDTNLLVVSYASHDRSSVAAVANEFVRAYTDTIVEMRIQPARQTRQFFAEQSKQVREELARAQAKLSEFRRSKGIATTDEKDDVDNMRLQELSAQLTAIQAARIEASRKHEAVAGGRRTADVPEVLANPLIQSLKGQLAIAEARLRERSAVLGEAHPEIARIRREVESLTQRLGAETANITGSLERNFQINSAREAEIRNALERQRAIVLANKTAREQLAVMQKDVDAAQRAYDALITRVSQASLESQATQANVALVSTATMPLLPSSPNIPLNLSIGVVFGALLGVFSALLAESLNSRVRFAEDLERVTGSLVVGELSAVPTHVVSRIPRLTAGRANPAKLGVTSVARPEPAIATPSSGDDSPTVKPDLTPIHKEDEATVPGALLDACLLSAAEVEEIASIAEERGVRFSEVAVSSGKVTAEQLSLALAVRTKFSLLDMSNSTLGRELVAAFDVNHPFMDDLRMLRMRIKARLAEGGEHGSRVVAVVSHGAKEGKSFSAANLAVSFAQMGDRTLLIDADMRTGRQHQLFSLNNDVGLSSVLGLSCNPKEALQRVTGLGDLTVMTAGPEVPSPTDLLARNTTVHLMQMMSNTFDVVIVDTPSADIRPDASLVVAAARNFIVVARQNRSLTAALEKVTQSMSQLGARMLGSVLVKA
ncbi:MAG: chain length determinant protein EpsF [Lautropia sp.]|nr:MAG: chain length determinant protein EpsF [Pseudomonadota bacterium]MBC6960563.1 chain length determinant protein EpsF [Lautropia sp.]MCL4701810.1 chain length determinant protein EpsF [Burkholderiaceae bacterium]MDL1908172.1 chain length determinant protein EpsF [Betaproteobacteria bacterium PRO1]RIK89522.1 MAG: chain length determinant protein EpsF [Burkholderiales bacterium]